ncbi:hypothetical protein [Amycolatopsis sp. CA-126428]|uniref:hypothetical protein n=1 Tax=Amycolatopsis sp. CA-126428 TaxID=2073158 RepID=UPI000CD26040|nr:hypothetical protein [Amycolatopsis sp. CA-126428]
MAGTLAPPGDQQVPERWRRYPRTPVPAGQTTLTSVTLALTAGRQTVAGEATEVPGLLLSPHVAGDPLRYTGDWRLVHAASGLSVCPAVPIAYAREVAQWYARAGIDWNRPGRVIADDPAAQRVFLALITDLEDARYEHRPLVYARTSWVHWPPLWRIWRSGTPDPDGFYTYADAAAPAESAGRGDGDAQIRRDTSSPGWALQCAAPGCCDGYAWFIDGWDGDSEPVIGERSGIERDARDVGWRDHDRHHWICSRCAGQYR